MEKKPWIYPLIILSLAAIGFAVASFVFLLDYRLSLEVIPVVLISSSYVGICRNFTTLKPKPTESKMLAVFLYCLFVVVTCISCFAFWASLLSNKEALWILSTIAILSAAIRIRYNMAVSLTTALLVFFVALLSAETNDAILFFFMMLGIGWFAALLGFLIRSVFCMYWYKKYPSKIAQ